MVLERVPLASSGRNEAWLRDFLLRHPEALPAAEIDPAYANPIPVCRELATPAGPMDALFVNRHGALTIVECKLWRNPQARREVVGQILDYAKELARWHYEDLQREVSRSLRRGGNALFNLVADRAPDVDEAVFVDAVGRNLRSGRFLLLVAGDGIREGTEGIVQFMHGHSGMRFAFGLVEMAGYELPGGQLLVQPRVLARTVAVERTVVRIVDAIAPAAGGLGETADSDTEIDADPGDLPAPVRRRDPAAIEADRRFWEQFVRGLRLDDPSQPPPRRKGVGWARYELSTTDAWITAYRARSLDLLGTYADFRGESGARLYAAIEAERPDVDAILSAAWPGSVPEWGETAPHSKWIALRLRVPGDWSDEEQARHAAWLAAAGNAFVNALRPRIQRILSELRGV
ncbi:hypothetical protein JMJ55_29090 [Belnapia sp. T6]|uniref:DUF4268 domain-containing protein n=1 Tax=Belnapia mucosa TaxID=2804532 RepID=A0ABS1VCH5_9PROT|nr:hypothetical protein [Belnapia mucosa]MBL6459376.1 hypothetical protein [Belnapia mucosa]